MDSAADVDHAQGEIVTPHRSGNRGTFIIDRRTRVGRIAVASGTTHAPTFRRLNEMISTLNETGRDDILRALREGELSPLGVYDAFRSHELHRLPLGKELLLLKESMTAWNEASEVGPARRAANKSAIKRLAEKASVVGNLPDALLLVRKDLIKENHPAHFNRIRATVLAFIRDTLKRSHRLYGEVRDVPLLKERKSPERHILTWSEVQSIAEKMEDPRDRAAVYGMALTGMGPKEWYVDGWKLGADRITIFGAKRKSRNRIVPRVRASYFATPLADARVQAERERRRFGERLYGLAGVHPYDLRRTYANWLESAGVSRTRRKAYLGHAGGDVTSIYERHEVSGFLSGDAARLEAFLAQTSMIPSITLVSGDSD